MREQMALDAALERVHASGGDETLAARVLARFEGEGVTYIHWKSNEHLEAAIAGDTDLDLLIDVAQLDDAYRVLSEMGCRRGRVATARNEVGLEDFFGVDPETGKLVHFHIHWRLASGERHLKRFRLPWERDLLAHAVRDEHSGVFVTAPAAEIVLAYVRFALKLRWRDVVRLTADDDRLEGLDAEVGFLMASTDQAEVALLASRWLTASGAAIVTDCLATGSSLGRMWALRREARRVLRLHRSDGSLRGSIVRWHREFGWLRRGFGRYVVQRPVLLGRGGSGGGLLVAVVGADGSGKSTLSRSLRSWFAPKFDTMFVYFGSGDGPASAIRWPLKFARRLILGPKGSTDRAERAKGEHPRAVSASKVVWALVLAREKDRKLRRAMLARTRGLLVITDRYPQCQLPGTTDGPLLHAWAASNSRLCRALARWEARPYHLADTCPPDIVLRLASDAVTARDRRPELSDEYLDERARAVEALDFAGARFGVVDLDASQPLEIVVRGAINAVFERL